MSLEESQPVDNRPEPKTQAPLVKNQLAREFLAEVLGTFLLCAIGLSGVAQFKFFAKEGNHNFFTVNLAFGLGATSAVLAVGKVSGAHLNPAVSFAMLLLGRISILKFIIYSIGQFIGAFLGALITFILYLDALKSYGSNMYSLDTAGIFATYPSKSLSSFGGFFDQTFATAILLLVILAINDRKNVEMPHGTCAILVGLTITMIGTAFAYNCGYAINPARDFGPRLFTLIAGWGSQTFSGGNYFFWIPIIGPMVGSLVGTLIYTIMIASHWN